MSLISDYDLSLNQPKDLFDMQPKSTDNMNVYFIRVLNKQHNYFGRNMLYYWFYSFFLSPFANK